MIVVREISRSFGSVRAVRDVSFELPAGQIAGLLGPNGAGKSTTIRVVTGCLCPDAGDVGVAGLSMRTSPIRARRQIGYLPESAPLYPEMTPEGYLDYRGRLFGLARRTRRQAIEHVVERCGLQDMRGRRIGHLSKGYKQRTGLAAALLHDPPVLILDEPTNGLDPSQIREARSLIRELGTDRTMLLCSHILPEIERTCDRVIIMAGGTVRADGDPDELVRRAPGPDRYAVEIRTNPSARITHAVGVLMRVHGADDVRPTGRQPPDADAGWSRLTVTAVPGAADLREAIAGAAADAGLFIRELRPERPTLESLFVHLVDEARMESGEAVLGAETGAEGGVP